MDIAGGEIWTLWRVKLTKIAPSIPPPPQSVSIILLADG
jgi:hypothetical protein